MLKNTRSLKGLAKFAQRDPWCDCLADINEAHLGPFIDTTGMGTDEFVETLGVAGSMLLFACIMDDFMAQEFDVGGGNVVDDYLRRRGWKENSRSRAFMQGVRHSVMSLYEITEVVPGRSFMMRDLIRGGEPFAVSDERGAEVAKERDRIAARVIAVGGEHTLANGVLPFVAHAPEILFDGLRIMSGEEGSKKLPHLDDTDLPSAAPLFTNAWLVALIGAAFKADAAQSMSAT